MKQLSRQEIESEGNLLKRNLHWVLIVGLPLLVLFGLLISWEVGCRQEDTGSVLEAVKVKAATRQQFNAVKDTSAKGVDNTPESSTSVTGSAAGVPDETTIKEDEVTRSKMVKKVFKCKKTGYVNVECLNVRKEPKLKSKRVKTLKFNSKVKYCGKKMGHKKSWRVIKWRTNKKKKVKYGYVKKMYLNKNKARFTLKRVIGSSGKQMSYEDYRCISASGTPNYRYSRILAHTSNDGLRMVGDRYLIAMGSYYATRIGTKLDLILKNGKVIKCMLGDQKANSDTHCKNAVGGDGSVAEFIVSTSNLCRLSRGWGNVAYSHDGWRAGIKYVRVYR